MTNSGSLKITTPTDREIAISRAFDAPRKLVYDAYTVPALLKRWLGARGGWSLAVCEMDLKVGGAYRWEWRSAEKGSMGVGGVYRAIVPGERIVSTEVFDQPWYEGEGLVTVDFAEQAGRTTVTTTLRYVSQAVRDGVLKTPMKDGLSRSYDKLHEVLAAPA